MLVINDFFVRYKEAVSNQMELISRNNNGKIISSTRFMGQKPLQDEDIQDNIYVYPPIRYCFEVIRGLKTSPKTEKVHIFEEEPSMWKRMLLNRTKNPLYISMYRRPNEKYAQHLKKYKSLKRIFVELPYHKEILINSGIEEDKIDVTPTPSKIPRKRNEKKYDPNRIRILFASWNNKEGDAIKERGLEYLLQLLQLNPNATLTIPLRDNDTKIFERMAEAMGVRERVSLLEINNDINKLISLFDDSDFVSFVPQKRIVKDVPNSLVDGLVRGKPVIISDVIDFSREVRDNGIGIVVKKGEKPFKFNISEQKYYELSQRAFEYSKKHSQENYLAVIEKAYNKRKKKNFIEELQQKAEKENKDINEIKEISINEGSTNKYLGNIR